MNWEPWWIAVEKHAISVIINWMTRIARGPIKATQTPTSAKNPGTYKQILDGLYNFGSGISSGISSGFSSGDILDKILTIKGGH